MYIDRYIDTYRKSITVTYRRYTIKMELSIILETSWGKEYIINVLQYAIVSFKDYLNGRTICIT